MRGLAPIKKKSGIVQLLFVMIFIGCGHTALSQDSAVPFYRQVDEQVFRFSQKKQSFDSVLFFVKHTFPDNRRRVRALYTWIASNISYDKELLDHYRLSTGLGMISLSSLRTQHPDTVMKYRKAVCEGFCLLMNSFCARLNIPSHMVAGITRVEGSTVDEKILHAWNAIKPDTAWQLIDITWSGGYISLAGKYVRSFSDRYFFTPPEVFIRDHWPLDAMWQMLPAPVTKTGFYENRSLSNTCCFNYRDSIAAFLRLGPEEQEYTKLLHYIRYDPENRNYKQAADLHIYNSAVSLFNVAMLYFEDYVVFAARLQGKKVNVKDTKRCISLLKEPRKRLQEGLDFCRGRSFFDEALGLKFSEMVSASEIKLKEIDALLADYRNLLRAMQ